MEKSLKSLIFGIATSLNADDTPELRTQIDEMLEFEKKLDEVKIILMVEIFVCISFCFFWQNQNKFKLFRKIYEPHFKNKTSGFKKSPELQKYYKYVSCYVNISRKVLASKNSTIYFKILYMDLMAPYLITNTSKVPEESIPIFFNIEYQTFLENTPKRLQLFDV